MKTLLTSLALTLGGTMASAEPLTGTFPSIDGGTLSLEDWRGKPVLVVNTASRCGFTHQYDDLQALQDRYDAAGLVVLAIPSNDFRQELGSNEEVKEFCEVNFNLTLPMTTITAVRGPEAHPFYQQLKNVAGFTPMWNFDKVLIGPDGTVVQTWRSITSPTSSAVTDRIDALLTG
ncbi:MAG: glutathione peroxidase [Pseudomonadota bacterium]